MVLIKLSFEFISDSLKGKQNKQRDGVCGYGAGWLSQLGATAQAGVVGPCLGCRLPIFETSLYLISPGLEAKVRAVGSLKPWTANVKVLKG